ncbi:MAG: hypothetical protein FJX92_08085 [Bacteroidetes bacterium]|nr:hypothetical protein [Bacteroidota bacterium]
MHNLFNVMIRQFFILSLLATPCFLLAQKLKTFSGPYAVSAFWQKGQAVYQYTDSPNADEIILKGPFKFTFVGKDMYKGVTQVIEGSYKDGWKHGQWTCTLTYTDFQNGDYFQTGSMKFVANYEEGLPHGAWKSNTNLKVRQLVYNRATRRTEYGPFSKPMLTDLKASFKDGILTGSLIYNLNDQMNDKKSSFTCLFDSLGFYNGKNVVRDGSTENIYEFDHGFLFKEVSKDLKTGFQKVDDNSKDLPLLKQLRAGLADDSKYKLSYQSPYVYYVLKPVTEALKNYAFSEYWHFADISGDYQYNLNDSYNPYQYKGLFLQSIQAK